MVTIFGALVVFHNCPIILVKLFDAIVLCVGLLLRMFMNLYNFEVIDEDAFIQWKEELNDIHPGKGQALFQV